MKLLIVGSRSIRDFDLSPYIDKSVDTVISGGASGIDALAEQYADRVHLSKYILRPRYERYGKAAPLYRNERMVELADAVLVIWDGHSAGARYTAQYAKQKGKSLRIVVVGAEGEETANECTKKEKRMQQKRKKNEE